MRGLILLAASIALLLVAVAATLATGFFKPVFFSLGVPVPYGRSQLVSVSLWVSAALLPAAVYYELRYRRERRLRRDIPSFLKDLAVAVRSGTPFTEALIESSSGYSGDLRRAVGRFVYGVLEGLSPIESFERAARGLPRDAGRSLYVVAEAFESGGRVAEVLDLAAEYSARLNSFEEARERYLKPYAYIVVLSLLVFYVTTLFLLRLAVKISSLPGMGEISISSEGFEATMYYTSLVVSLSSGILLGKVLRGRSLYGLGYSLIFLAAGTLAVLYGPSVFRIL